MQTEDGRDSGRQYATTTPIDHRKEIKVQLRCISMLFKNRESAEAGARKTREEMQKIHERHNAIGTVATAISLSCEHDPSKRYGK
jgi:hypothetical protein